MELTHNPTDEKTLRRLDNPFYKEVVMKRVKEVVNHLSLPPLKRKSLRRTYDDINLNGTSFSWIDEGQTRDELRVSDAFQVRMMLNEEFEIRTTEAHVQNFKNHYQTLITVDII